MRHHDDDGRDEIRRGCRKQLDIVGSSPKMVQNWIKESGGRCTNVIAERGAIGASSLCPGHFIVGYIFSYCVAVKPPTRGNPILHNAEVDQLMHYQNENQSNRDHIYSNQ